MTNSRTSGALGIALFALAFLAAASGPGAAQKLQPAVIAVIDSKLVFQRSAAGKDIAAQVENIRTKYQAEIDKREAALKAEEAELRRQQTILAPEAFAARQRDFQTKVLTLRRFVNQTTQRVDQSIRRAEAEVNRTIATILSEISGEFGYNIAIDKSQVWNNASALDISAKVLELLDKRLPKMPVQVPVQE